MSEPTSGIYHFEIGNMTCMVVSDVKTPNTDEYTQERLSGMFPGVAEAEIAAAIEAHRDQNRTIGFYNTLFIDTGTRRILIDGGMGVAALPRAGNQTANLVAEGITPESIDTVFLTHAHPDHYLGMVEEDGRFVYPNALHIIRKEEWEHWTDEAVLATMDPTRADMLRKRLFPLEKRLMLFTGEMELAPGVHTVAMPGHTPGHTGLLIESNGERLLVVVDILHTLLQAQHLNWQFRVDSLPDLGVEIRKKMLSRAAEENLLTLAYHLPFPGLGHFVPQGDAFAWQPIA